MNSLASVPKNPLSNWNILFQSLQPSFLLYGLIFSVYIFKYLANASLWRG